MSSTEQDPGKATEIRAPSLPSDGATRLVPRAPAANDPSVTTLGPGSVIKNRFVIESVIGRGGMGVVYRARDQRKEETQDRDPYVALKVLSDQFRRDPTMIIGLQREARKAQTLAHPNITTVFDFDRDGDMVYITMEVLEGKPLNEVIEAHPEGMEKVRAHHILRGLCLGLAYAHNKNIIHSDFKPGNVFVTEDDRSKILDFGIARAAPVDRIEASQTTQFDAATLGALTPSYASAEMFEGQDPHPSDDVYALAIVAYQLFSGRHPFDFVPAPQARSQKLEPRPIKGLSRREWRAIRRGLAFERAARSANASDFLRDLEGSPRLRIALAAAAVLLVGAGGYIAWGEYQRMLAERPDVEFASLPAETQQKFQSLVSEGSSFENFGDAASALELYRQAYDLHPRNPEAVGHIESLVSKLVTQSAGARDHTTSLAENLDSVMRTDDFLRNRKALITAHAALTDPR